MDSIAGLKRTHTCNDLGRANLNEEVVLMGWVLRRRDHGGVIFIDLRDRWGITQVVFNPVINSEVHAKAHDLRGEWVLAVRGRVENRPEGMTNPNLKTGAIEVLVEELRILNTSKTPPFPLDEEIEVSDTLRLKYRYLDLRRPVMAENIILRHKACQAIRSYLNEQNFLEIETPVLTKSTPEGARDYLVPSRVNAGRFFALPQSPQLFKQLLMMAGMDRYYQIVRCFRDEDLRADRQPEFTQIDMELSFVEEEDIIALNEGLMQHLFRETLGVELQLPFPRMTYAEAMDRYGTDRPDTRFGLELNDLTGMLKNCDFKVFRATIDSGGMVKCINAKGCSDLSRKDLDDLTAFVGQFGAKGMAWVKIKAGGEWQMKSGQLWQRLWTRRKEICCCSVPIRKISFSSPCPNCVWNWPGDSNSSTKSSSIFCGSLNSRCSNMMRRKSAMWRCIIPSPPQTRRICPFSKAIRARSEAGPTIWY
jgi:aspartyl-tRNA synthetase